ncbi:hypothetical protein [Streptomyces violaceorubidus]|uniref:hypothetical protein n=1 Tax=Streptomyces violaceorubidus TaxID=284042 RepID=UPI0004C25746|nr:hypothetical protein [Streptomyces violaceorubidus]
MNRENPNENDLRLLAFMEQILNLSDDTNTAGRIILLGPTGEVAADASLSARDLEIATKALAAARAFTEATKGLDFPADAALDPVLEQDLEEHCIGLDTDFLMQLAAEDPRRAVAAFDEITEEGEL